MKEDYPHFIWIEPPLNKSFSSSDNERWGIFAKELVNVTSLHKNTFALQLKKVWDSNDKSLYNRDEKSFMAAGFAAYWNSVDKAVKYADTILLKKEAAKKTKEDKKTRHHNNRLSFERFHWHKPHWHFYL